MCSAVFAVEGQVVDAHASSCRHDNRKCVTDCVGGIVEKQCNCQPFWIVSSTPGQLITQACDEWLEDDTEITSNNNKKKKKKKKNNNNNNQHFKTLLVFA